MGGQQDKGALYGVLVEAAKPGYWPRSAKRLKHCLAEQSLQVLSVVPAILQS